MSKDARTPPDVDCCWIGDPCPIHNPPPPLSPDELERLVNLFPYPRHWTDEHTIGAEARAALMANNTPAVARKWLEKEGLLDEQQVVGLA